MLSVTNALMSASLIWAGYTIVACPCEVPCECKMSLWVMAVCIPLAYVTLRNT